MDMKRARAALFGRIEREILPDSEKRIQAIRPFTVANLPFGARPTSRAFASDGDLRFDLGLWDGGRFVPFDPQIVFPLDPSILSFAYPKETAYGWRNINVHYTPVTRRIDYVEVRDAFIVARTSDRIVREQALGLLAATVAGKYPAEAVETTCDYVRYAEQYVVVTGIRSRAFAAAGEAEAAAIRALL